MKEEKYIRIGSLVATYGYAGEMILRHNLGKKSAFKGVAVFFLEMASGQFLPYFAVESRVKNDTEVYLRLEGIASREKAAGLLKKQVWLPETLVKKLAAKHAPVSLLGFSVVDAANSLGEVLEVIEQPNQILLRIEWKGKEAYIPLNESTLLEINHKKKEIRVDLPEGLLEIYL
jgi:16S rRNA processing protein RimM